MVGLITHGLGFSSSLLLKSFHTFPIRGLETTVPGDGEFLGLKMYDLLVNNYHHKKQVVWGTEQNCCGGRSPQGGERFRNCTVSLVHMVKTLAKRQQTSCVPVLTLPSCFLPVLQHANCLERGEEGTSRRSYSQIFV